MDIPFEELNDNLEIAENISDKGSWGTGNTRLKVNSNDNFEYIIDLINKSLENERNSD